LISKTTLWLCRKDKEFFDVLHNKFLNLQIPFDCVGEGQKVFFAGTGLKYMVVKPESSLAPGARSHKLVQDKNHN